MDHSIGWRADLISLSPFRHISLEGICFHCRFYGFTVHWYSTLIHTKRIDMPFSIFIEGQGSRSACLCWQIFSVSLASVALKFSLKNAFYASTQTNIFCAYAKAIHVFLLISSEHLLPQFTFTTALMEKERIVWSELLPVSVSFHIPQMFFQII